MTRKNQNVSLRSGARATDSGEVDMKSFNRIFAAVILVIILLFVLCNYCMRQVSDDSGRQYRVEANRIANEIGENGIDSIDLSEYSTITAIVPLDGSDEKAFFETESDYVIREISGELYRIEYNAKQNIINRNTILMINIFLGVISLLVIGFMLFIRYRILKPFNTLREVPYELSKGNLTVPIKENKNKFFGRFVWGIDLLREKLEQSKKHELELQKEKKTLLLSLSHDIKTPLSAIKLYSKALSKNLYPDKNKQLEIAESINNKADEIESFVSEIIKASNEDFLYLEVNMDEFYLSQAVREISEYYKEKLYLIGIDFIIGEYSDCILKGDLNRLVEVIQNITENAVKYGDGHIISLEFSEEEDCKLITVKNGGCTLPETELPHIFDSFWRGSNAGSCEGSGLGLYICRQLMHKMDGEIFAEIRNGSMLVTVVLHKC